MKCTKYITVKLVWFIAGTNLLSILNNAVELNLNYVENSPRCHFYV